MKKYIIRSISVNNLYFDIRNPRHEDLENQESAIKEMIVDQGDKLISLARDILTEGINPSDLPIVIPDETNTDGYTVVEGNRRLAAIKLMLNPNLANLVDKPLFSKIFTELATQFSGDAINILDCAVFTQREDADHWIELKHTGENNGIGTVSWGSQAIARFKQRKGKPNIALQVVDFIRGHGTLSEESKQNLDNIRLTNIERLVGDSDVQKSLGIKKSPEGNLETTLAPEEVVKGLQKIVVDVADKNISVNDIRHKSDRLEYLKTFTTDELPDHTTTQSNSWRLNSKQSEIVNPELNIGKRKKAASFKDRKTLIPNRCTLNIEDPRISKIFRELKGLEVDSYPNVCAIVLRIFLELSLDEFATKKASLTFNRNTTIQDKTQQIAEYIANKNLMTDNELKPIRVVYSMKDGLLSAHTLNAYVHNKNLSPTASDLKTTWDNMQKFFETIWA